MGGMKVSNMDFIKLLPAFMQDDEARSHSARP